MRLERKDFQIGKNHIYIIPSVEVVTHDMIYCVPNVAICFHWLVFHARLLFLRKRKSGEYIENIRKRPQRM